MIVQVIFQLLNSGIGLETLAGAEAVPLCSLVACLPPRCGWLLQASWVNSAPRHPPKSVIVQVWLRWLLFMQRIAWLDEMPIKTAAGGGFGGCYWLRDVRIWFACRWEKEEQFLLPFPPFLIPSWATPGQVSYTQGRALVPRACSQAELAKLLGSGDLPLRSPVLSFPAVPEPAEPAWCWGAPLWPAEENGGFFHVG